VLFLNERISGGPAVLPDTEVRVSATRCGIQYLQFIYLPSFGPKGTPGNHSFNCTLVAFKTGFYITIADIAHPAVYAQVPGNTLGLFAIRNSLNKSLDQNILAYRHAVLPSVRLITLSGSTRFIAARKDLHCLPHYH
jgi:hypothetical protein